MILFPKISWDVYCSKLFHSDIQVTITLIPLRISLQDLHFDPKKNSSLIIHVVVIHYHY